MRYRALQTSNDHGTSTLIHALFNQLFCYLDCKCLEITDNCYQHGESCYVWPEISKSWYASRSWCTNVIGGHLLEKSDLQKYIPEYSMTEYKFYWIGLRQADWVLYYESGIV